MKTPRILLVAATGLTLLLVIQQFVSVSEVRSYADEPQVPRTHRDGAKPDGKVVAIPVDAAERQKDILPYMHAKLGHSQKVFEGLVTRDFEKVETAAEALMLTTLGTPGVEPGERREDEVFEHLKLEFLRLSGRLKQTAKDENLEGAAYVHEKLNATCIACHQYLRDELPAEP